MQTAKLRPEQAVDQPVQFQSGSFFGLPNELLLRIISFLSPGSIRNLMVNRYLRPVCEQGLYESISLPGHPRRSIRLLETFLLRADLALLVRHLEIDLSWQYLGQFPQSQVPSVIQPNALEALLLAKNIQSLSIGGYAICEPEKAEFREAIFKMKLIRLELPMMLDPESDEECTYPGGFVFEESDDEEPAWSGDQDTWDGGPGNEIRKLLQAQPLLEEFKLSDPEVLGTTAKWLQANILASDVPSLKYVQAAPEVAMAFLRVAPRLESLNLMLRRWDKTRFSQMKTYSAAANLSIRHFAIRVSYSDKWFWDNLTAVLSLFPDTQDLSVTVNSLTADKTAKYFFAKVVDSIYVLPSLRNVDVTCETLHPQAPIILEVDMQSLIDSKTACPMLETVVDPKRRLWTFRPDRQVSTGFAVHLVGPLMDECSNLRALKDLPAPKELARNWR
ncbi:hypothetical protein FRC00_008489 [Tulasnella sp. 408]|nr:hypothetical protein FRC00_008489 [Tulasnella sp. 408]